VCGAAFQSEVSGKGDWLRAQRGACTLFQPDDAGKSERRCGRGSGLGVVVASGSLDFQGPGSPNGPPSPRLAPGGFYCVDARGEWNRGSRGVGPCQTSRRWETDAQPGWRSSVSHERAKGMDARSERPARWHGFAPSLRGCGSGLGVVVVSGRFDFQGPGSPNGPPSRRLAPGGFYGEGAAWRVFQRCTSGGV